MQHSLVFDCEFLTAEGAPSRFWCGPRDPDPVVAQIGVVKIGFEAGFPLLETLRIHVIPKTDTARASRSIRCSPGLPALPKMH